ncbi:MAG: thioester reductase domain-containing protein [Burkholderiales bacterium]|nr:thioester reductase domain-containing protein [Burkholderiales bacterium]
MNAANKALRAQSAQAAQCQLMRADGQLADSLRPPPGALPPPRVALLTGATGFLGRYAARELLAQRPLTLVCLVRGDDPVQARDRLLHGLRRVGVPEAALGERVEVVCGDVAAPSLGIAPDTYARLAERIDVIYHCAAEVNWARSYRQLRHANVLGPLALLQLACAVRAKPLVFVSTIAVCYAHDGPNQIDERSDMSPHLERMPLGYAQSKCVAEMLLRSVAARGLPVTVLRPALISGDSKTGETNLGDLLAALLECSVSVGAAIDVDWLMDCVPVDFVAQVIARTGTGEATGMRVLHLLHERARPWREVVLWMNLSGYPLRLLGTREWLDHTFVSGHAAGTRLHGYRRFFQGSGESGKLRPFEVYLEPGQRRISSDDSRAFLAGLRLSMPPLDAALLHRYFDHYEDTGLLGTTTRRARRVTGDLPATARAIEDMLRSRWRVPTLEVVGFCALPFDPANGVLNEIASARLGSSIGMRRYELLLRRPGMHRPLRLITVIKTKASDAAMQALTTELAELCDPALGRAFGRYANELPLARSQERELALYEMRDPRLRRHTPRCYGTVRDAQSGVWLLALEYVANAERAGISRRLEQWAAAQVTAAVRGLAAIHSVWYGREAALRDQPWLPPEADTPRMLRLAPLWQALRDYAAPSFRAWAGPEIGALHARFIDELAAWWPRLVALPLTLIHNDFNPRNITLRDTPRGPRLCAFDWELAGLGAPQHDLAEFLCFVSAPGLDAAGLRRLLELHRTTLETETGQRIASDPWREGFALALRHLLIDRLPMYALIHRFRPQDFLPRVVRNWLHLYRLACEFG